MLEAKDIMHTFLQQLVVQNDVFIRGARDPDVELGTQVQLFQFSGASHMGAPLVQDFSMLFCNS